MSGEEAERWGFLNRLCASEALLTEAMALACGVGLRTYIRARHDQEECCSRNGTWAWTRPLKQKHRRRRSAWPQTIFIAPTRPSSTSRSQSSREIENERQSSPGLAVFRGPSQRRWPSNCTGGPPVFWWKKLNTDVDQACCRLVRQLGADGWLKYAVGGTAFGGSSDTIDTRAICLIRETLGAAFRARGLCLCHAGSRLWCHHTFWNSRSEEKYLPAVAKGQAIAAFALSELNAGSDVGAMQCEARRDGDAYVLSGDKTWISNGGIADFYVVFARTGEGEGSRGVSAFIVESGTPGFEIAERVEVIAPHPLARLVFKDCRVPSEQRLGEAGHGFKVAMATLDVFRTSVAAAALGFARRAMQEVCAVPLRGRCSARLSLTFN